MDQCSPHMVQGARHPRSVLAGDPYPAGPRSSCRNPTPFQGLGVVTGREGSHKPASPAGRRSTPIRVLARHVAALRGSLRSHLREHWSRSTPQGALVVLNALQSSGSIGRAQRLREHWSCSTLLSPQGAGSDIARLKQKSGPPAVRRRRHRRRGRCAGPSAAARRRAGSPETCSTATHPWSPRHGRSVGGCRS